MNSTIDSSNTMLHSFFQSDLWLFSVYTVSTFEIVFWFCNAFLIYIELYDHPSIDRYRIQQQKPKLRFQPEMVKLMIKGIIHHQFSILFLTPIMFYILNWFGHVDVTGPRPAWSTIIFQIAMFILAEDFIFYWTHYLFHTRWLYTHIHKKHHVYKQPTGVTAVLSDPIEGIQNQLSIWLLPVILKEKHIFTLCLWILIRVYQTVNAHSGYNLPYVSTQYWAPWLMSGALAHDYHHQHGKWNYGSFFTIWDRLMDTHRLSKNKEQIDSTKTQVD